MTQTAPPFITETPLSEINLTDRRFVTSPPWYPLPEGLLRSIKSSGVMVPVRLCKGPAGFIIVSGFRRCEAAGLAGLESLPATLVEGLPDRDLFLGAVWENLGTRALDPLEQAEAVGKLVRMFNEPKESLIDQLLPGMGLRPSRYHLDQLLSLFELDERLKRSISEVNLLPEIALKLDGWEEDERDIFLALVKSCQLGRNKQKQISELLEDLRRSTGMSVGGLWETCGLTVDEDDRPQSADERFRRVREGLMLLRYPQLTKHELRFVQLRAALQLPPRIRLQVPEYFEGDTVSINIESRDIEELRGLVQKMAEVAEQEEMTEIFELL